MAICRGLSAFGGERGALDAIALQGSRQGGANRLAPRGDIVVGHPVRQFHQLRGKRRLIVEQVRDKLGRVNGRSVAQRYDASRDQTLAQRNQDARARPDDPKPLGWQGIGQHIGDGAEGCDIDEVRGHRAYLLEDIARKEIATPLLYVCLRSAASAIRPADSALFEGWWSGDSHEVSAHRYGEKPVLGGYG